jgi:hypothetical protein
VHKPSQPPGARVRDGDGLDRHLLISDLVLHARDIVQNPLVCLVVVANEAAAFAAWRNSSASS